MHYKYDDEMKIHRKCLKFYVIYFSSKTNNDNMQ